MSLLTPEELREIRRLHIEAGRSVDAIFAGEWRSAVRGRGMEFEEVRSYQPGDDVRHIDWNVTARTGEPFVKVFREERQNTVVLAVDVSGSTRTGSGGRDGRTDRRLQLSRIAGGLAYASFRNRDRVGLVTFSDRIERYLSPRRSRAHTWGVIQSVFEGAATSRRTDVGEALRFLMTTQRRRCTLVLVSDFLDERAWDMTLAALRRRHAVHAVLVTDPLDEALPRLGLTHVIDAETGQARLVDAAALRGRWSAAARLERLQRTGARAFAISTADDPFDALRRQYAQKVRAR